jgi:hypothetical protein
MATNSLRAQEKGEQAKFHKNIAQIVKQELDSQKGFVIGSFPLLHFVLTSHSGTWHVIVGRSFGSFVTHETKT